MSRELRVACAARPLTAGCAPRRSRAPSAPVSRLPRLRVRGASPPGASRRRSRQVRRRTRQPAPDDRRRSSADLQRLARNARRASAAPTCRERGQAGAGVLRARRARPGVRALRGGRQARPVGGRRLGRPRPDLARLGLPAARPRRRVPRRVRRAELAGRAQHARHDPPGSRQGPRRPCAVRAGRSRSIPARRTRGTTCAIRG